MRALCGAIITAGALIGLGLTAFGFGTRYSQTTFMDKDSEGHIIQMHLSQMDKPLVFILVFLTIAAIIGFGIAFVGLAYHHHRRLHEMRGHAAGGHPLVPDAGAFTRREP
jgi:uncharacterized membrane protein (DUF106 family)